MAILFVFLLIKFDEFIKNNKRLTETFIVCGGS